MSGNLEVAESLDAEVARMYGGAVQPGENHFYAMTPAGMSEVYDGEGVDEDAYKASLEDPKDLSDYEAEMDAVNGGLERRYH